MVDVSFTYYVKVVITRHIMRNAGCIKKESIRDVICIK